MTSAYVDTSWLVAIAFGEPGWQRLADELDQMDALYSSTLLEAELRSALAREEAGAPGALLGPIRWIMPDRPLSAEIAVALAAGHLRGADLWHVACALFLAGSSRDLAFLTLDRRQAEVTTRLDFTGAIPGGSASNP